MIIGLFGILKAGGAYVPLDPSYPENRLRYILENSQIQVLLTKESTTGLVTQRYSSNLFRPGSSNDF